ncbi:UvrD-helicase domain-containing protein [Marinactinospora thermotolerans]|uniref:DNA 3'-5' helicase n=1 Tax=Marinactinospora thermotolerans DSM 45154 TaxID=1122192 RepID=A0A1T4SSF5_9ACTN|nr:UvrD-helicase domain-containing protein [Marinactinospora thermotolerans]SKA31169.1 TIGR00375 family protein [Marinactinospora thermotolerans DSM 45154]
MEFHADLHIHSKYSRACSKDCDLEHLAWWAARKGIDVVGTGDFTHPAWREELHTKLVPAEPGLFRLKPEIERQIARTLPPASSRLPRFMLSVEISTIYKRDERTRKVHHLLYAPSMTAAEAITADLAKIGNLASDGRPILGLDSRDLLEITLSSDPGSYLVPAHVWTPWFAALGSKSGFDAIADCYVDLAEHVFAVETGLSSDPAMNWMVSSLDSYTLVSNSDAHSPPMLAREATRFDTDLDYYAIRRSLETGEGFRGTVEFFPEEGKYHLDGHRKCGIRFEPELTREHGGRCPVCGRPLTVGVFHRVHELADRPVGYQVPGAAGFTNLVPLPEIVSEIVGVGPKSKRVLGEVARLVGEIGPELSILQSVPLDEVTRVGGELLGEAIGRLRRGEVIRDAGYDGEYGVIRMFRPEELTASANAPALFEEHEIVPKEARRAGDAKKGRTRPRPTTRRDGPGAARADAPLSDTTADLFSEPWPSGKDDADPLAHDGTDEGEPALFPAEGDEPPLRSSNLLTGLDPEQRAAAGSPPGPLLIIAGPGTGKTRTLTHRIAHLVTEGALAAEQCLAITFTRRSAEELRERLTDLVGARARSMTVTTFHGLGALILREQYERVGLSARFQVADDARRLEVATEVTGSPASARRLLEARDEATARGATAAADEGEAGAYERRLREQDLVDFTDLLALPVRLLEADNGLVERYRRRWRWIGVDEYQDVDAAQYRLLRLLTAPDGDITAIGDPDQAIYGFRGADVGFFLRFTEDFPAARTVRLSRNYRSNATIVDAAVQAIAPASLVPGRELRAVGDFSDPPRIGIHVAADERAEASFVARAIDRLLGGTSLHSLDSGRVGEDGEEGLSFGDFCVLYRTDAQSEALAAAFDNAGVPFQKRSHDRLTARPAVRMVAGELARVAGAGVEERVRNAVAALCDRHHGDTGLTTSVRTAGELLAPLARRCGDDLEGFLAELSLGAEVDALDPRADRVSLLTLHAAKGLEYPVVFLVGCEEGLLPLRFPGAERDDDAEERRLFFVGLTRARRRLYLSRARRRTRRGSRVENAASSFLEAIPSRLTMPVDEETATRRRPKDRQLRLL